MANRIQELDPIQGLIDYVNDIKPFHTKIIEVLSEYVAVENINTTIQEQIIINIGLHYGTIVPQTQCYNALGGETIITASIVVRTNIVFVGAPPLPLYDFNDTIIYLNGVLLVETTFAPVPFLGDYTIDNATNQITFTNPLTTNDEVKIYTFTQTQEAPGTCDDGGYGTLGFDFPNALPVVSPDAGISISNFPAITPNSFIVLGNQLDKFNLLSNLTLQIESFVENTITAVNTPDVNNTGIFTISNAIFTPGNLLSSSYTTVFINGILLVPPTDPVDPNERYVSLISTGLLPYTSVLGYSNELEELVAGAPADEFQTPDEGSIQLDILNVIVGGPDEFVISGDFRSSNLFISDEFSIINSTGNDGSYTITTLSYNSISNETTLGVGVAIFDTTVDGTIVLSIPSNTFFVDGNYTGFFQQGIGISVTSGTAIGVYTVLNSIFNNNQTQIRVIETIIDGDSNAILSTVASPNGIVISGDLTTTYVMNSQFNIISSMFNNGAYTVSANSTYNIGNDETTILVTEAFDVSDASGEIHEFIPGNLLITSQGFGQHPLFCEVIPDTVLKVGFDETLNIGIFDTDNMVDLFQYVIINTTVNSITVHGDATDDIVVAATIRILHSDALANDGTYTISVPAVYDSVNDYTTISVIEPIIAVGNTGGWIEGNL